VVRGEDNPRERGYLAVWGGISIQFKGGENKTSSAPLETPNKRS